MSKRKATFLTILFAIILYTIIIISMFIGVELENGDTYRLFTAISAFITGSWSAQKIEKFYKWLKRK